MTRRPSRLQRYTRGDKNESNSSNENNQIERKRVLFDTYRDNKKNAPTSISNDSHWVSEGRRNERDSDLLDDGQFLWQPPTIHGISYVQGSLEPYPYSTRLALTNRPRGEGSFHSLWNNREPQSRWTGLLPRTLEDGLPADTAQASRHTTSTTR